MKELSPIERLTIAQAAYKALGKLVDTKSSDSLRSEMDREMMAELQLTGSDRRRLMLNGQQVGTYSVKMTKPVDTVEPEMVDAEKFIQWLRTSDGGLDTLRRVVFGEPKKLLKLATIDGELPDGCRMRKVVEPQRATGTVLRVDTEKVAAALGGELPSAVVGLISGEVA